MIRYISGFLLFAALAAVLSTVFVTGEGVITAKYFQFATAMCAVSALMLPGMAKKSGLHVAWHPVRLPLVFIRY